jgi:hypothetical protein
LPTAP